MKKILTIILLLLPLCVFAQSKESDLLYQKGMELFDSEKYEEALPYFQKSDSLDKAILEPTAENYYRAELKVADCWEEIAYQADYDGHYNDALNIQKNVVEIRKKIGGGEAPDYAESLNGLANIYSNLGNYTEAIRIETIVMKICKKTVGEENGDYAASLFNLACFYSNIGNYSEAIRLGIIALEICKNVLGEEDPLSIAALSQLAGYYNKIGNYTEAIRLGTYAMKIRKKVLGEEHPNYAISLNNLAIYNDKLGNYTEAIKFGTLAVEIYKKVLGEEHPHYATSLSNLSYYYSEIGNYTEAIKLETLAMEIRKKVLGEEHPLYAVSLNGLSLYYDELGNYTEAIRLGTLAMKIRKKVLGEEHPDYASSLHNLASYNGELGNYTEAIRLETLVLEIQKKVLGEEHPDYARSLSLLANYNDNLGQYAEAISLATRALDIRKKVLGKEHPNYTISLRQLADLNLVVGNYDKAVDYYSQCYRNLNSFILKTFASMTTKERDDFWKKHSALFTKKLSFAAYKMASAPVKTSYYGVSTDGVSTINALAYDAQIFSKGLLLNAELEIQKLIDQSGDTIFANRYYKLKQDRAILDNIYQTPMEERKIDADSLSKVIDREERNLVESSKALGDYTKNLSISWRDVQNNLKNNDLSIEFANFKDTAAKQTIYVAIVLKKGMKAPKIVKLFNLDDFAAVKTKDYYTTPKLYNLIWKPLSQYLKGAKTVFFSPAGLLHTIGIEYLPNDKGKIFAEMFDAYRLSSTRELALAKEINPNKKAATYGGIKYNFTEEDWQNLKEGNDTIQRGFKDSPLIAADLRGGGADYLIGTSEESIAVANLLRMADYDVCAFSGNIATEESFKSLSGSGLKILHIGTHGFYESEGDMENMDYKFYTAASQQSDEDKSLSRSGLLFAGVNSTLDQKRNNEIPEGFDDGVLTAKEISRLDFSGLDLVVLSACQTGLGEITGEGVFGLQRGFKKAGAQTIVMSLWEVFDDSTQLLMTEFFKNLTAGMSKRAAFIAAQGVVRAQYPDPEHWAAFVMVDGM